jgi:hypothetical protein
MAIEIKEFTTPESGTEVEGFCFRCTTSGLVFGPTMDADDGPDVAEEFLQYVLAEYEDPRNIAPRELAYIYNKWRTY